MTGNIFSAFRDHAAHRAQRRRAETPPLFVESADVRRAAVAQFRAENPSLFAAAREIAQGPSPSELAEKYRAAPPVALSEAARRMFRSREAAIKPNEGGRTARELGRDREIQSP